MRCSLAVLGLLAFGLTAASDVTLADRRASQRLDVKPAIARGLAFLVKDALAWKSQYHCVSCHHASLVIWSMREAERRGHVVDGRLLAELTKWVAESGDGKTRH